MFWIEFLQVEKLYEIFKQVGLFVEIVLEKVRRQTPGFVAIVGPSEAPGNSSKNGVHEFSSKMSSLNKLECFWQELGFRYLGCSRKLRHFNKNENSLPAELLQRQ